MGNNVVSPTTQAALDSAHAIVSACFHDDMAAVRHIVDDEDEPTYLVMALGVLCREALDRLAAAKDGEQSGFEMWQRGLQKRAANN